MVGAATAPKAAPQSLKTLGGLPKVEAISTQNIQTIKNKFPNDPIPKNGRIIGTAKIENGLIKIDKPIQRRVDFVVDKEGNLILGSKHHFLGNGRDVQAAGTMKIVNGKVKAITNRSGHYQPTIGEGRQFPEILRNLGLDLRNTKLEIFEFKATKSGYVLNGQEKLVINEYLK